MSLHPVFEVHQARVEALLGGGQALQHGGATGVEPHALDQHTREEPDAGEIEADDADDHGEPMPAPHRDTRMARERAAISVSPMAANACATLSIPSGERSLRAWNSAQR